MKKILILGVAPVQAEAIEKLNDMGYETYAIAMKKDGPGADAAQHFEEINIIDEQAVSQYIKDNQIDAVYSVGSDLAMPVANKLSEALDLPHFVSYETAYACNHKDEMRQRTKGITGSVPFEITQNADYQTEIDYPVFVKPTDGQGQRGISLVETKEALPNAIRKAIENSREGSAIIERYIDGYEISVNGYVVDGKLQFTLVSMRETWPQHPGLIHKHVIDPEAKFPMASIEAAIQAHLETLQIDNGPVYAQVKVMNDEAFIIEITPRFDGCHMHKLIQYYNEDDLLDKTFKHLLENQKPSFSKEGEVQPVVLEFMCETPNQTIDYNQFKTPEGTVESYRYYNQGDMIRPVNGVYDKVGFYIYPLKKEEI
ncbi:ATP-grasp domain-containing protein [Staphylococcus condimenti]|uniref:ATP-grasp domain-containing protein n=1 Tax=Staphylococcus condimenti TaxID=70255 RepID=A0A4Q7CR89_9STAP|nr:ATP-grasp domain-containing protein [Staphylococcus condimenti]RZI00251.1 ATP-grasp domain-containing protein [Staphylococcus condimenti]RZI00725.1 ATP-grasp domain-containing protein [Staphylococcus condimenti]